MGAPVTFVYANWIARYPEFVSVNEATAQEYFNEATLYWRNDGTSPCRDQVQLTLLNMVTAHIAALYSQAQGSANPGGAQDPNTPTGRVSTATVGSVTVTTELNMVPTGSALEPWFMQTRYGMSFWGATTAFRRFRYALGSGPSGGAPLPVPGLLGRWQR